MLFDRVSPALAELGAAVDAVRSPGTGAVTVSVSTSLASYWLTPRLPEFKRRHPAVELRVVTTDSDRSVGIDDADLWIPLGTVTDDNLVSTPFCQEEVVPVASPDAAAALCDGRSGAGNGATDAARLLAGPLLHLEERYAPRFDWTRWFRHMGIDPGGELPGDRSNDYSLILQAALEGQGVALGWRHIVADLLSAGRLVEVGPSVRSDQPFPILTRKHPALGADALALRDWLIEVAPRLAG